MNILKAHRINHKLAIGREIINELIVAGNGERAGVIARDMVRYARERGLLFAVQLRAKLERLALADAQRKAAGVAIRPMGTE